MTGEARGESRSPRRSKLTRARRLLHERQFEAVYEGGRSRRTGPLRCWTLPNGLDRLRLGLSMPRRVGSAPVRNRIKRLLREAYRVSGADWPQDYDVVVHVQRHEPLSLEAYRRHLDEALRVLHGEWTKRHDQRDASRGRSGQSPVS